MLNALVILLSLGVLTSSSQTLSLNLTRSIRGDVTANLALDLKHEGSFVLQRSANLSTWTTLSNFNSLPRLFTAKDPVTGPRAFYRMLRQTNSPQITLQPEGVVQFVGPEIKLEAQVIGSWPLRLQWHKGTTALSKQTNLSLTLPGTVASSGSYTLLASNQWGMVITIPAVVQVTAPVAPTISGKSIQFVIQSGRAPLQSSGNYTTTFDPSGFYTTQGSNALLNDSGFWNYTRFSDTVGYIQTPGSIAYPNGLFALLFTNTTSGTFQLTVPSHAGFQTGGFNILN